MSSQSVRASRSFRLTYGPGYRVYYLRDGDTLILLLVGGDKSTQHNDISKAHELAAEWHADKNAKGTER